MQQSASPTLPSAMSVPDNYRILDQFLDKEGFLEHVQHLDPLFTQSLINIRADDSRMPNLAKHVQAYLEDLQASLTDYYAKRLISTRPRYVSGVGVKTCSNYSFTAPSKLPNLSASLLMLTIPMNLDTTPPISLTTVMSPNCLFSGTQHIL